MKAGRARTPPPDPAQLDPAAQDAPWKTGASSGGPSCAVGRGIARLPLPADAAEREALNTSWPMYPGQAPDIETAGGRAEQRGRSFTGCVPCSRLAPDWLYYAAEEWPCQAARSLALSFAGDPEYRVAQTGPGSLFWRRLAAPIGLSQSRSTSPRRPVHTYSAACSDGSTSSVDARRSRGRGHPRPTGSLR